MMSFFFLPLCPMLVKKSTNTISSKNVSGLLGVCRQINKGIKLTCVPNLDIKDQSVGNDLFFEFINWLQRPVKVGSLKNCCLLFFVWQQVDQYPEFKRSCHNRV